MPIPELTPRQRALMETALAYGGHEQTIEDVLQMCESGEAQWWDGANSVIVTQIQTAPNEKILHVFLAFGVMAEIRAMAPIILQWGIDKGCTKAQLFGRRGWARSFLKDSGWHDTGLVILEKQLNGKGIGKDREADDLWRTVGFHGC